jgi:glycine/D-amino acid oxidase-like deaminating enzyme
MSSTSQLDTHRRPLPAGPGALASAAGAAGYSLSRVSVGLHDGKSRARPVSSSDVLPKSVEVVIIGGGFVGTSAALTLAERGIPVALCEKGVIAGEASGRSMGYVDSQHLDPIKLELVARSKELWAGLNARTGLETGYRPTGVVEALNTEEQVAGVEGWLSAVRGLRGTDGRILRGSDAAALFPDMVNPPPAVLHTPGDGSAEPQLAAPAMAEAAHRQGAAILQGCAVRGLEFQAGRISGVVTEKGVIACRAVLLAAGCWSPMFARSLGISIPQLNIYLSMMGLSAVPGPRTPLSAGGYGFRPQIDGGYSFGVVDFAAPIQPATVRNWLRLRPAIKAFWPITHIGFSPSEFWRELTTPTRWALDAPSPFESRRIQVPDFRAGPLECALVDLRAHFPVFRDAAVRERWAGVVSSLPDNMPIISAVSQYPGLFVGTGFTFGLTMGPAAGEALADLAIGREPAIDLHPYRLGRFGDGSELTFRA